MSKYFLIAASALLMTASCKKAVEVDDIGATTIETAITKESDLDDLLSSAYFALADDNYYGGSFQVYNEILADHIDGSNLEGFYQAFYNRSTNIFNTDNANFYAQISKIPFQSNLVLDNIALASAARKSVFEGHAKFLRSLAFFDLVRMYAQPYTAAGAATQPGIPMRLTAVRQVTPRSTVAEVYQQIITDLKEAENKLPAVNGVYATKWSAKALLAKVYFQMNDFTNAYAYANDVISNGGFGFDADFSKRFSALGTPETVFGLTYESANQTGRFNKLRSSFLASSSALPPLRLTASFYNSATSNTLDKRIPWYRTKNGFFLLGKFDSTVKMLPVLYITELKLIRAESAAELDQNLTVAIADMNDIINRAYGTGSSMVLPGSATAAMIRDAARRERDLELAGEGNRLQELKRRGAKGESLTIRGAVYNCPGLIFPFPSNEAIYLNIQNPIGGCN